MVQNAYPREKVSLFILQEHVKHLSPHIQEAQNGQRKNGVVSFHCKPEALSLLRELQVCP
jgi:hypothetical protein